MSLAGAGNAAAGSLLADTIKAAFTPLDSKPATKGDLNNLKNQIVNRYHKITNREARARESARVYWCMCVDVKELERGGGMTRRERELVCMDVCVGM